MDELCLVGTDIAGFFLFEPETLEHRATSPWCWFMDDQGDLGDMGRVTVPERCDGRLAWSHASTAFRDDAMPWGRMRQMGCEGLWAIRCTTEGLRPAEAAAEYVEARDVCEVVVTHERLLLDGGYVIPYEGAHPLADALTHRLATWLALPNGRYEVTTHVLYDDFVLDDEAVEVDLGDEALAGYLVVTLQRRPA